jgi:preprotein translocase subunit SecD
VGPEGENYGCAPSREDADDALAELTIEEQVAEACLVDDDGTQVECFPTEELARAGKDVITVAPATGDEDGSCLVSATGEQLECFPTRREAQAARDSLQPRVTEQTFCVTDGGGADEVATPTPTATPTPSPSATAFSTLSLGANELPCGLGSRSEAQAAVDAASVQSVDSLFCVISSAGQDLGCYIDRASAEERRRSTGQQRLLEVIGQTARLEQRPVLAIVPPTDPAYAATPVTCPTDEERQTDECSFSALEDQEVVYEDEAGNRFRLGPSVIAGGDIVEANAVLGGATGSEWTVSFRLSGDASARFADATTRAVSLPPPQNQIAIVVDRAIISAPTVQNPITGGTGDITGGFSEEEARDLATVLNSGALPVELTRQQVQTVSPTLGAESLRQGIVAGVVGLVLLFLYLLFYYRLLGIVAWFGMSIWAILAIALISLAGIQFGYALTLAGVAGLVISLGVTADSYIVFFERLKDEVRSGKTARAAVQPAFARSYKTIIAADVVAGIAAVVLYVTAVSSVRGFALTLGVSTLLDLFVVWFFKRPTVFLVARNERLVSLKGFGLEAGIAGGEAPAEGART